MSRANPAARTKSRLKKLACRHYQFRLFMVGDGPNSQQALSNLQVLCEEHLQGRYTIEKIDVVKNFAAATRDNILITPALVMVSPLPRVIVLGNLNDRKKLLFALRLSGGVS